MIASLYHGYQISEKQAQQTNKNFLKVLSRAKLNFCDTLITIQRTVPVELTQCSNSESLPQ